MIGSQATKGMHVLAKFAPLRESCGESFFQIQTHFPAPARKLTQRETRTSYEELIFDNDIGKLQSIIARQ